MDIPAAFLALQSSPLLAGFMILVWLVLALVCLQVTDQGRILIPCLLGTFFILGVLVSTIALSHIAFTVWISGLFSVIILYLSLRALPQRPPVSINMQEMGYRILIGLGLGAISAGLGYYTAFPSGQAISSAAVWVLVTMGIFRFATGKRSMEMGIGLLLILAGTGVWLISINDSPLIPGLWSAGSILLSLVTGWLTDRTEGRATFGQFS